MEKLAVFLNKLGFLTETNEKNVFNLNEFTPRLFYQKLIYLILRKSDELDYSFNWYIRGPYSPDLARDLFNINKLWSNNRLFLRKLIDKNAHNGLIDHVVNIIKDFESSFKEKFDREWNPEDLEILASLIFIENNTFENCRGSKANTIKEFKERKYELKDKRIEEYWDLLESTQFV